MKRAMSALLVASVTVLTVFLLLPSDEKAVWDLEKDELAYYRIKRDGKVPRAKRRPNDWFYVQRAYPEVSISAAARLKAAEQAQQLAASAVHRRTDPIVWEEAGPSNVPGRITDLAVHPSQPEVIYAASAAGGIFKSTDFGSNWTAVFDDAGVQSMGAIAIHPEDPLILYAGTGEANSSGDSYEGTGIYRSTDGGSSWSFRGLPNSYHIGRIVIDPLRPDTVFAAVAGKLFGTNPERGLYRSTDGGATWEQKLYVTDSTACIDFALHPTTGVAFAAMWERWRSPRNRRVGGLTSSLYRSTDFGQSWTQITRGLPANQEDLGRMGVSVDPESNTVYVICFNHPGNFIGLYKSTDLGENWTRTNDGELNGFGGGFGWYFGQVRVAPGDPGLVFALGVGLYRSNDGGASWVDAGSGAHVDHHAMYILPDDHSKVYDGSDGGVNYSTNGGNWWTMYTDMPNTQFYAITIDHQQPQRLYGGTQDNGTLRTLTGSTDNWDHIHGGDGFYVIVDPTNSDVIYAEYQWGGLRKSTNLGSSWSNATNGIDGNDRTNWNTPVVMDPSHNNVLYYGANRLYKTTDGANNWTAISGDLTNGDDPGTLTFGTITTIDVAATDSQVIYVGTDDANVWVTTNGGSSWQNIGASLPDRWITRVAVDPYDPATAYVTLSGYTDGSYLAHVYRTPNYGQVWIDIHGNLPEAPVNDIIIDPHHDSTLFVASDFGVFVTTNLGLGWSMLGQGMPMAPINDLAFHPYARILVAGTHGRSMYKTVVGCPDPTDSDDDGIGDGCDNCPAVYNPLQEDIDHDYIGDACDDCIDPDNDGYGTPGYATAICPDDNCPNVYNPDQTDSDGDGTGDSCEFAGEVVYDTVATPVRTISCRQQRQFRQPGHTVRDPGLRSPG
ncbi:MAG: glycosyl hydrolase [bacterium]